MGALRLGEGALKEFEGVVHHLPTAEFTGALTTRHDAPKDSGTISEAHNLWLRLSDNTRMASVSTAPAYPRSTLCESHDRIDSRQGARVSSSSGKEERKIQPDADGMRSQAECGGNSPKRDGIRFEDLLQDSKGWRPHSAGESARARKGPVPGHQDDPVQQGNPVAGALDRATRVQPADFEAQTVVSSKATGTGKTGLSISDPPGLPELDPGVLVPLSSQGCLFRAEPAATATPAEHRVSLPEVLQASGWAQSPGSFWGTAVGRVLVGTGQARGEVRVDVAHGALAGAHLHLKSAPSGLEVKVSGGARGLRNSDAEKISRALRSATGQSVRMVVEPSSRSTSFGP